MKRESTLSRFLVPKVWISAARTSFRVLAALATNWANPPNIGIWVVCFVRDIGGVRGYISIGSVMYWALSAPPLSFADKFHLLLSPSRRDKRQISLSGALGSVTINV